MSARVLRCLALAFLLAVVRPWTAASLGPPVTEFHPTWVWTHTSQLPNAESLLVADLDGRGAAEVLLIGLPIEPVPFRRSSYWFVLESTAEVFEQTWTSFGSELELLGATFVAAPDPGIVVWSSQSAAVHDPASKQITRSIPLPSAEINDVLVANVDGSPGLELVACDADDLFVLDFETGAPVATRYGFGGFRLEAGQIDADAASEIAVAGNALGLFVLDGADWTVDWGSLQGFDVEAWLIDLDGDPPDEVVVSRIDGIEAWDLPSSTPTWSRSGIFLEGADVAPLGPDGPAIVGYSNGDSALRAIALDDGSDLWSIPLEEAPNAQVAIGNVDADPALEILLGSLGESALIAVDSSSLGIERMEVSSAGPFHDHSVADVDADGAVELVTTYSRLVDGWPRWYLKTFDLGTRRVEPLPSPDLEFSSPIDRSVVVQIDDDAALEICLAAGSSAGGGLVCLDGASFVVDFEAGLPLDEGPLSMTTGDVDGDGRVDVLVASDDDVVHAFGGDPFGPLWSSASYGSNNSRSVLRVGQVDLDTATEIVLAGVGFDRNEVVVLEGPGGALQAGPFVLGARALEVAPAPVGSPGSIVIGTFGGDIAVLDLATGTLLPPLASLGTPIGSLRAADLDRDGDLDLAAGVDDRLVVVELATGSTIWTSPFLDIGAADRDSIYVVDSDRNTVPELLVGLPRGFAFFEAPWIPLFVDGFESGNTGAWNVVVP
jgi:hypothetical protein